MGVMPAARSCAEFRRIQVEARHVEDDRARFGVISDEKPQIVAIDGAIVVGVAQRPRHPGMGIVADEYAKIVAVDDAVQVGIAVKRRHNHDLIRMRVPIDRESIGPTEADRGARARIAELAALEGADAAIVGGCEQRFDRGRRIGAAVAIVQDQTPAGDIHPALVPLVSTFIVGDAWLICNLPACTAMVPL